MKISKIYHQNGVSWNVPCEHVSKTIHHWIVFGVCGVHNVDYLQDPVWIICWTVSDLNDRERLVAHSIWAKTLQKWCESLSEWLLFVWFYWCDKLDRVPTWLCKWVGEPDNMQTCKRVHAMELRCKTSFAINPGANDDLLTLWLFSQMALSDFLTSVYSWILIKRDLSKSHWIIKWKWHFAIAILVILVILVAYNQKTFCCVIGGWDIFKKQKAKRGLLYCNALILQFNIQAMLLQKIS